MSGYIGRIPVTEAIQTRKSFTASLGQTAFSMSYQPGFIDVFLNGVKLREGPTEDFIATNGTSIVLNAGALANQNLDVVTLTSASIIDKLPTQSAATNGKVLKSDGTIAAWQTDSNTVYTVGDGGLTEKNFTTALNTKLTNIETAATADQTDAEIKTAYEANADTNEFSDAEQTKLSGIATSANLYTHPANHAISVITGLQTALDAKTTPGYVDTQVANLVDSAPATLDTLKELATALGDDANHVTTMTTLIGTKLPLVGGTMTGDITFNSTQTFDGRDVSADGTKLDGIATSANLYVHPTGDGNIHVPAYGSSTSGQLLTSTGTGTIPTWQNAPVSLPSQSGNADKQLTTDGSSASWTLSSTSSDALYQHSNTVSNAYIIANGNNAMSAGPITIGPSGSVTIPSTSTWIVS